MRFNALRLVPHLFLAYVVLILTVKSANSIATNSVDSLCHPHVLDPAIRCACFAYFFSEYTTLEGLNEICLQMLPDHIETGYLSCKHTTFMESTGMLNVSVIDQFFHNALQRCVYTDSRYQHHVEPLSKQTNLSSFAQQISPQLPVSRAPERLIHEKLLRFCLVVVARRRLSRREACRMCCPGTPLNRCLGAMGSNKPTPETPEVEESPPPVCQQKTLRSASECGCQQYKEKYSKYVIWTTLNDRCDDAFGNIVWSASPACTTFMESQQPGVPFNESVLHGYIDEACETCSRFHVTSNSTCPSKVKQPRFERQILDGKLLRYCIVLGIFRGYSPKKCFKNLKEKIKTL